MYKHQKLLAAYGDKQRTAWHAKRDGVVRRLPTNEY